MPKINHSSKMDSLNLIHVLHILILFTINIASSFGLTDAVAANYVNDRLSRVEALLETVINKNQELEKRVEHLETELNGQKRRNGELLKRISKLESKQNTHENKKVQVGKDQEKAQSEKDSHSKNRGGKKPN